jgi:ABC-type nitrate/sulfonate/bicarbonate transport system permease component
LVIGTFAGVAMAVAFVRSETVNQALMPLAIALQSAPIVAMTPLITLSFGRNIVGISVIVALVTFFPTLLYVMQGLRSAPIESVDLVTALGGGPLTTLRKVQVQHAVPALFAALKIAIPGAIFGTMLAELLSTGTGLGYQIVTASINAQFNKVWADVVVITAATVALYGLVSIGESLAHQRYSPDRVAN